MSEEILSFTTTGTDLVIGDVFTFDDGWPVAPSRWQFWRRRQRTFVVTKVTTSTVGACYCAAPAKTTMWVRFIRWAQWRLGQ